MKKAYSLTVLVTTVAIIAFGVALVSADDAEAANWDVELIFKDAPDYVKMARGLNPITFNMSVTHTGTALSEEVHMQMRDPPALWNIVYSATTQHDVYTDTHNPYKPFEILLNKGETADMIVTITPPLNQLNQTFWFHFNAWPKKEPGRNESATFGVVIPQVAAFEISFLPRKRFGL